MTCLFLASAPARCCGICCSVFGPKGRWAAGQGVGTDEIHVVGRKIRAAAPVACCFRRILAGENPGPGGHIRVAVGGLSVSASMGGLKSKMEAEDDAKKGNITAPDDVSLNQRDGNVNLADGMNSPVMMKDSDGDLAEKLQIA
ncbi:hypothetical protein GUJ93_ZPchr0008g13760 [Zizania palustris]|uniref:Uncharacterized protein n=1 Tax=Zizania palustris TaxID=103762 RepID=A0A8J5RUV9_ZIZPA|nr:hypothetical protein GUJ93_ZPchr0008g13760 [Zizania palustris]